MPREAYSDQVKRDVVAMYEDHSHVSLKAAVKELGTALGSRGVGWEGVGKQGRAEDSLASRAKAGASAWRERCGS